MYYTDDSKNHWWWRHWSRWLPAAVTQHTDLSVSLLLAETQVITDKPYKSVGVFIKVLDVVVSGALNPQRLHGVRTSLVDGTAVGEINDFIILAMDHKHRRRYPLHLVNAAQQYNRCYFSFSYVFLFWPRAVKWLPVSFLMYIILQYWTKYITNITIIWIRCSVLLWRTQIGVAWWVSG